jgi:hypothetical protein
VSERVKLVCPHCDSVVATAPADHRPEGEMICSHCNATVQTPTIIDEMAGKVQSKVQGAVDKIGNRMKPKR